MEYKYKIGDIVFVSADGQGFVDGMKKFQGKEKKIIKRFEGFWENGISSPTYILEYGGFFSFREDWLLPIFKLPEELFEI
jgi:hypothetical protein